MELTLNERDSLLRWASDVAADKSDEDEVMEHAKVMEKWVQKSSDCCPDLPGDSWRCLDKDARMKAMARAYVNDAAEGTGNVGEFVEVAETYYGFLIDS